MKYYLLLMLFSLSIFSCNAQNIKTDKVKKKMDLSFIKNDKIKYSIVMMACDTCSPIKNVGDRVVIELNKKEQSAVKKISKEDWLKLLNNDKSDYSANLILYSIYGKDALVLSRNDDKERWRRYMKSDDIEYWQTHLP